MGDSPTCRLSRRKRHVFPRTDQPINRNYVITATASTREPERFHRRRDVLASSWKRRSLHFRTMRWLLSTLRITLVNMHGQLTGGRIDGPSSLQGALKAAKIPIDFLGAFLHRLFSVRHSLDIKSRQKVMIPCFFFFHFFLEFRYD